MTTYLSTALRLSAVSLALIAAGAQAAPTVSRLTPPSELFSSGNEGPGDCALPARSALRLAGHRAP